MTFGLAPQPQLRLLPLIYANASAASRTHTLCSTSTWTHCGHVSALLVWAPVPKPAFSQHHGSMFVTHLLSLSLDHRVANCRRLRPLYVWDLAQHPHRSRLRRLAPRWSHTRTRSRLERPRACASIRQSSMRFYVSPLGEEDYR
jgi:hypothetical protein